VIFQTFETKFGMDILENEEEFEQKAKKIYKSKYQKKN
jgi:hypothetical protein